MKKLLPILFLSLASFYGCSKDESSDPSDEGGLKQFDFVGKWEISEVKIDGEYVPASETCFKGSWAEFKNDKSYSSVNNCDNQTYNGTYVSTDGTILCKVGGASVVYKIISQEGRNKIEFNINDVVNNLDMRAVRK
ncbi:hypothetical protein FKG96_12495 [Olivibacter sp. LS-1]|uniref:lipocalin family protein n=1 Tax=Olivibacter sp. LS-1 TaxID=2592345 RepID=UPI0011EA773A|nr:lipocalin family protein [Olivibacter sp. LS-1]QEL01591.1 hypothetical protein FKG96_12495 [Olivibacter sp. LS-1]